MTIQSKIMQWRNAGRFCAARISDYGELFQIELAETKTRVLSEVVAFVALAVGALFTLSFVCIAVIISAAGTPYFIQVAWGVAGAWLFCRSRFALTAAVRAVSDVAQRARARHPCDQGGKSMNHADAQSRMLARMAQTREEFVMRRLRTVSAVSPRVTSATASAGPWALRTPNAAFVSAPLVGLVVLGPRRALQTALQAGLSTWTTKLINAFVHSTTR